MSTLELVIKLIEIWLKESRLNTHYEIDLLDETKSIFVCKKDHIGIGTKQVRLDIDGAYIWEYTRNGFDRIYTHIQDPEFFDKLEALLLRQCQNVSELKSYRQI